MEMRGSILKSSLWMLGGNGLQQVLQFGIFILLARFLSPEIFGAVALAFVFLDVAAILGKWGINDILLQRKNLSKRYISHAFLFSLSLAFLISLVIVAGTGIYIYLNDFDLMAKLMFLLVPVVMLQAAEMVPETLVRRKLDFKRLAFRNNIAALIGGIVALILAFYDMGVYALVTQRFVALFILLGMVWLATGKEIRLLPRRGYNNKIFRNIGHTGWQMVSSPLSTMLGPRLTDLLVGAILGTVALGYLKVAKRIFDFVSQLAIMPVASVAQAAFPQLAGNPAELKRSYRLIQGACALGVLPLFAGIAVTSDLWVPLLLGKQWMQSVELIQWTSLLAIPAVVNYFQIPLLIAYKRNRLIFIQNTTRVILSVIVSGIGVMFGLVAVVQFSNLLAYAYMIYNWVMIRKIAHWPIWENITNVWPAFFATCVMLGGVITLKMTVFIGNPWLSLALESTAGITFYGLTLIIFFRKKALDAVRQMKKLLTKKKPPQDPEIVTA